MWLAGGLAEKRYTGRRHNWAGAAHDLERANELIGYATDTDREAAKYADYLRVVAEDTVASQWTQIDELAQELLVRKTMTGREVKAFVGAGTAAERLNEERASRIVQAAPRLTVLVGQEPDG